MNKSQLQQALESTADPIVTVHDAAGNLIFEATITALASMAATMKFDAEGVRVPLGPWPVTVAGVAVRPVIWPCKYEKRLPFESTWSPCEMLDVAACIASRNYDESIDAWQAIHAGQVLKSGTGIEYRTVRS